MFEIPEMVTLSRQINATLRAKEVSSGNLGNSPHKFVWYNRTSEEFDNLVRGKQVGTATARGRWLFVPLEPGYVLVFGECGGKLLYHAAGQPIPAKYHLLLNFNDGSTLTMMTQMWGAMELYDAGKELERQYIKDMRPTPNDPGFTKDYFTGLVKDLQQREKRSVKSLLTQDQLIPGLGNSIAQDILFNARLRPKHTLENLDAGQIQDLYDSILTTLCDATQKGGRSDEVDLFGKPGRYVRKMSAVTAGQPCPICYTKIEKLQYLGGACYFCPHCQS